MRKTKWLTRCVTLNSQYGRQDSKSRAQVTRESRHLHKTISNSQNPHTCKNSIAFTSPAQNSPSSPTLSHQALSCSPSPQDSLDSAMPLKVSKDLRTWMPTRHGFSVYLNVYDAPAHPQAQAIAKNIHPDTISNNMIHATLTCSGRRTRHRRPLTTYLGAAFRGVFPLCQSPSHAWQSQ